MSSRLTCSRFSWKALLWATQSHPPSGLKPIWPLNAATKPHYLAFPTIPPSRFTCPPRNAVYAPGVAGALCAHLLCQRGASVTVMDMGKQVPGEGAHGGAERTAR